MMNATNITDRQIRTLRAEAEAAGDYHQVDLCQRALAEDVVDQDGNEIPFADMTRDEARALCAAAIAHTEAQS